MEISFPINKRTLWARKTKKYIFSLKNVLLIFRENGSLVFQEMGFSSPNIKKNSGGDFQSLQNKKTLWKNFLYFGKWNLLAPSLKNFCIFSKNNFSYISGGNLQNPKIGKILYLIFFIRIFCIKIFPIRIIRGSFYLSSNKLRPFFSLKTHFTFF